LKRRCPGPVIQPRLVRRYIVALNELVRDSANPWRRANDVARYGGMPMGILDEVLAAAVEAGLIERHADDPELVTLTAAGLAATCGKPP
jgi:hypothetical protein